MEEKINALKNAVIERYDTINLKEDEFVSTFLDYLFNNLDNTDIVEHEYNINDNLYDYVITIKANTLKLIVGENNLASDIKTLEEEELFNIIEKRLGDSFSLTFTDDEKILVMFNNRQAQ